MRLRAMARHVVDFKTEGGTWQQILYGMIISKTKMLLVKKKRYRGGGDNV